MPIPDFQTVMLPLLVHLSDGKEHSNQETLKHLAEHYQLSDEELAQLLPSGLQAVFTNRVAWVKSHLKAAGMIESPRHGLKFLNNEKTPDAFSSFGLQTIRAGKVACPSFLPHF